jgi:response regulator RpfG family c-di-GMP phosphodiesterase
MVTLLIVDDYLPGLTALELLLESKMYRIVTARSGGDALNVLVEIDVALIVTDERMEDICGSELAARVRAGERNRTVPIVLLSGVDAEDAGVRRATALPGVTFAPKPVNGAWLRARVAELLLVDAPQPTVT